MRTRLAEPGKSILCPLEIPRCQASDRVGRVELHTALVSSCTSNTTGRKDSEELLWQIVAQAKGIFSGQFAYATLYRHKVAYNQTLFPMRWTDSARPTCKMMLLAYFPAGTHGAFPEACL